MAETDRLETARFQVPDLPTLTLGLTSALRNGGHGVSQVSVLEREPNIYASSFASEIVTCGFEDGSRARLLWKYGAGHTENVYGHKRTVQYEAEIYRRLLQPSPATTPKFYGTHTDKGGTWLVLEYLDGGVRLDDAGDPGAMRLAARWVGRFHAANEALLSSAPIAYVKPYDAEYYVGWARRTLTMAGNLHRRFPWLRTIGDRFECFVSTLLALPQTVIHGEFYPHNIIYRDSAVYPIDWESAAIAIGEIDLASLTDDWPEEVAEECEQEYRQARWPDGPPPDFARSLDAARLYWSFRWLGDRADWTTEESTLWRFEFLHSAGERLGLI